MSPSRHDDPPASERVTEETLRGWPLPQPNDSGGKEARGTALVIGGSPEMPGGALLAGEAVLRAGAGRLQIATCASVAPVVAALLPEARVFALPETRAGGIAPAAAAKLAEHASRATAVLIGPGMLDEPAASRLVQELARLVPAVPLVLDAGALEALRDAPPVLAGREGGALVTPHAGELAHLTDEKREAIARKARAAALDAARRYSAVVALKGATTWIADPRGRALCHEARNAGLGTSGSGDTLSGIATGLLARGAAPLQAAAWAVYLHAQAGEVLAERMGPLGFLPRELLAEIPRIMARMTA
jgi:hydroxyethylthiazole kinase-like uncharacterized protein yjeF